jgi:L-asparaginase/Glu-tRNA(Gln) amidotransferase subunit D
MHIARCAAALAACLILFQLEVAMAQTQSATLDFATRTKGLPSVAIVATGGTIAERTDPKTGGAVPAVSAADLVSAVPGLSKLANIGVLQFSNIDSSQMTPMDWARLSLTLDSVLERDDIVGAVVTHGTDTMAEGAFFVDMTLQSDKPVVFTGAMNDASNAVPDGPGNLTNAVIQVLATEARGWGVTVTLNRYVNSARHVRKSQTTNVQTFESGEKGYLGYVFGDAVQRMNDRIDRVRLPLPNPLPDKLPDVPIVMAYAGSDGRFFAPCLEYRGKRDRNRRGRRGERRCRHLWRYRGRAVAVHTRGCRDTGTQWSRRTDLRGRRRRRHFEKGGRHPVW